MHWTGVYAYAFSLLHVVFLLAARLGRHLVPNRQASRHRCCRPSAGSTCRLRRGRHLRPVSTRVSYGGRYSSRGTSALAVPNGRTALGRPHHRPCALRCSPSCRYEQGALWCGFCATEATRDGMCWRAGNHTCPLLKVPVGWSALGPEAFGNPLAYSEDWLSDTHFGRVPRHATEEESLQGAFQSGNGLDTAPLYHVLRATSCMGATTTSPYRDRVFNLAKVRAASAGSRHSKNGKDNRGRRKPELGRQQQEWREMGRDGVERRRPILPGPAGSAQDGA